MKTASQERTHYPPKKKGETDNGWKVRVANAGLVGQLLTPAQIRAREEWHLCKMYDPNVVYNANKHFFDLNNPFPAFYGEPRDVDDIEDQKEKQRVTELVEKNPKLLAGLRPMNDMDDLFSTDEGIVFIAFDPNRDMPAQFKKAKAFLQRYQQAFPKPLKLNRSREIEWARYLRMLDAEAAEGKKLSLAQKIKEIEPSRKDDYYPEVNGYAHDTMKAARNMASSGFKKLLFNLSVT